MAGVALLLVIAAILLFNAVWPPSWAPDRWRHWTRPLRRKLRPRHYR